MKRNNGHIVNIASGAGIVGLKIRLATLSVNLYANINSSFIMN